MFREVAPPERLVYTEIFAPFPDVESVVTTVLTEEGGKTRITVNCVYPSKDVRDMVVSRPGWSAARRSATTGSKTWSASWQADRDPGATPGGRPRRT